MAFHFTLNGLLRLRESFEHAELQRLQRIASAVLLARAEIESADKDISAARLRMFTAVTSTGLTGAELQLEIARESALNALRSELSKKLFALEQKRKEQQSRYLQVRTQREILSSLYKRRLAEYELEQSRRAQRQIDELFLIRRLSSAGKSSSASTPRHNES